MIWIACALAQEADGRPTWELHRTVEGVVWDLQGRELRRNGVPVAREVLGEPVFAGELAAWVAVVEAPVGTAAFVWRAGEVTQVVGTDTRPDRLALSGDGTRIAYVSGRSGWASVYVRSLVTGDEAQLTNVGLVRAASGPPEGFVAPPREAPVFRGDQVCWAERCVGVP
ncbi:MAG: hypothetical protein R3F61_15125 [Myxococcota bacterium]